MSDFPVQVTRTKDGKYSAKLADFDDGPVGHGIDPYAAREDLLEPAVNFLRKLREDGGLPTASAADDRPVISLDSTTLDARSENWAKAFRSSATTTGARMLCYSWTNHFVLHDSPTN